MTIDSETGNKDESIRVNLAKVFHDTELHQKVARIICDHLINFQDIRNIALDGISFTNLRSILDLGCGFGYFTRGLKDKIVTNATIIGIDRHSKYRHLYLEACNEAGIKGEFISNGISVIENIPEKSVDLILCSYALYFFPEYIKQISRILKNDGVFVVITHARPHMKEFTQYVKDILYNEGIHCREPLPYESLISGFSNENGQELLSEYFADVKDIIYKGRLLFNDTDFESFKTYFKFKRSFFIPCKETDIDDMSAVIMERMKNDLQRLKKFEISKEDIIFVCRNPQNIE
jgi:ubiquinone/menaquinone biosynthesis C-methylase UbiE